MKFYENEWFIEAPWGRICIMAWGDCLNPPVLVVHGAGDSLASFRPLISQLPTQFYYVGFELPGYGKSTAFPPGMPVRLLDFPHCIEIVRRHFRWERFIYLAHSMAGTIGRLYNLGHPGRFIAAIEIDQMTPSLGFKLEQLPNWYKNLYEAYYERYDRNRQSQEEKPAYTWDQMIKKVTKGRPELTPALVRATIERFSEPAGDGKIRLTLDVRRPYAIRPPITREQWRILFCTKMDTPTLGIITEGSKKHKKFENTPFLLEDYGNYRVKFVEGGHDVHIAHPERIAPFVSQFLLYGLEGLDRKAKL
ncbi:hypothetical protein O0L34_g970 [Tuta absoluta]|nr:hypothetical protein O0L34_g970 [Tuta absoluta]